MSFIGVGVGIGVGIGPGSAGLRGWVGYAAGSSVVTGIASGSGAAIGASAGSADVTAVGKSTFAAAGSSAGTSTATAEFAFTAVAVGSAAGVATVAGVSAGGLPDSLSPVWSEDPDSRTYNGSYVSAIDPTSGSDLTDSFEQATEADQPTEHANGRLVFSGDQVISYAGSKSDFTFLHYDSAGSGNRPNWTIGARMVVDTVGATQALIYTGFSPGIYVYISGTGAINATIKHATGNLATGTTAAGLVSSGTAFTIVIISDGENQELKVRINGSETVVDSTYVGTPASGDSSLKTSLGASETGTWDLTGQIGAPTFFDRVLTGTDLTDFETWLGTQ